MTQLIANFPTDAAFTEQTKEPGKFSKLVPSDLKTALDEAHKQLAHFREYGDDIGIQSMYEAISELENEIRSRRRKKK